MKFVIRHRARGRLRVHLCQPRMTCAQADILSYSLQELPGVSKARVYEETQDVAVQFTGDEAQVIEALRRFSYGKAQVPSHVLETSGRAAEKGYREQLLVRVVLHYAKKLFLPMHVRAALTTLHSVKYLAEGAKTLARGKIEVPVLDATAIGASLLRRDFATAGSVIFLLGIGEILAEWTHKKSVDDLARSMSLHVTQVWVKSGESEVQLPVSAVREGDEVVVRMGGIIPFDGTVTAGEGMVNQASLTGEAMPVRKSRGATVFAGTVLEEGELSFLVKMDEGSSRYEKIIRMIEDSEKLKSAVEARAEHMADRLVPWSLGGAALTWLITRNVTKAVSILMVDFSCALKLAMPISVLSAIREAGEARITVKGGKFLEAIAQADTIVFDKTGTLTRACPRVAEVVSFCGKSPQEILRVAACLEEHFPHSMARAVVDAAKEQGLVHEEMHSEVEYIVAHGIASRIGGEKAVIGSYHFVFEDEGCRVPAGREGDFAALRSDCSLLYLAVNGLLCGVICIDDPLRPEAAAVINGLRDAGFSRIVMMTGDSDRTARVIAKAVGVDAYYAEVLPEEKAGFVQSVKEKGGKVVMIGDGVNDSPALSAADVGIAISDGAAIAREIADVTIAGESLQALITLKEISVALMRRIRGNYRFIVGFNGGLILAGVFGLLPPTTSALLHNGSTIAIGMRSMKRLLPPKREMSHAQARIGHGQDRMLSV